MSKIASGMKSLFTIAKNAATGVDQTVAPEVKAERLKICEGCDKRIKATNQCGDCFCFLNFKTSIKQEKCPLGKWSEVK